MSRILVIEDTPESARLAEKLLMAAGHEVTLAATGEEGFMQAAGLRPDLILVDLGLPDLDGQTVVSIIRRRLKLERTPIVAFTAWPLERAEPMAKAYGCDGVISKPIDTRAFADQVTRYLVAPHHSDTTNDHPTE